MKMLIRRLVFLLVLPVFAATQNLPADTAVTTGRLPNGFTYYIRKNNVPAGKVILYLACRVGSLMENSDQQGLAHFMEHMNFNGTTHFPGAGLVDILGMAGVRFGADLNAYTEYNSTVYKLPLPLLRPGTLDTGLLVMRDWAGRALLDSMEIEKERGVVLEEKRLRSGTKQRMEEAYLRLMLDSSLYVYRPAIGKEEIITQFLPGTLRSYFHDWYRPDLQALIVVGDVDVSQVRKKVVSLFSDMSNPSPERLRPEYIAKPEVGQRWGVFTDDGLTGMGVRIAVEHGRLPLKTVDDYKGYLTRSLFNLMISERIREAAETNTSLYLSAGAGIGPYTGGLDVFTASVNIGPAGLEKGVAAMWQIVSGVGQRGFRSDELVSARQQYLARIRAAYDERRVQNSGGYAQEYTRSFIEGAAAPGIEEEYVLAQRLMGSMGVEDVDRVAREWITDSSKVIFLSAPQRLRDSLPGEAEVRGWLAAAELKKSDIAAQLPDSGVLLPVLPAGGKTVFSKNIAAIGVEELRLSNGVRIVLKPTDFSSDEILFEGFSPGGTSLYSDKDYFSAANAAGLVDASGAGRFTSRQLQKMIAGKRLAVAPFISERIQGIGGRSDRGSLETTLQLLYLYITQPRKDTALFRSGIDRALAAADVSAGSPERRWRDTVAGVLSGYSIRRMTPGSADLRRIDAGRAYEIYKERFSGASNFTFVVTGSFDTAVIRPMLERYLGSLPPAGRKEEARDLGIAIPGGVIRKTVYGGPADKASVRLVFSGDWEGDDAGAVRLQALKFILGLRLINRLREQDGGVYSPSVDLGVTGKPAPRYGFTVVFTCAPGNVERLIADTRDEVAMLQKEGPSPREVEKFVTEQKVLSREAMRTNPFWLSYLAGKYERGEPLVAPQEDVWLDGLTPDALKREAEQRLSGRNFIRLVQLPGAGAS